MKNISGMTPTGRSSTTDKHAPPIRHTAYIDSDLFSGSYIVLDLYTRRGNIIIAELYVTEESYAFEETFFSLSPSR